MKPKLPGYQIGKEIYEGTRTLVYRGIRLSDSLKVVIKFLRNSYPRSSELVQFRNQYAIAKSLNSSGIVQPLSLERSGNGYALVMPDLGAISLDKVISRNESLELGSCLDIAIQLADILQELDRYRVIHKDIKPANILIQPETQEVKLIDFSIASLLPRETQEIKNFNVLEGTLAYISPEQTGRMNRGIDYRSDFYSLGATLYQLLTGTLPFISSDPMELVHCHISQQPIPPAEVKNKDSNIEIPPVVSQIVMKLMAKNSEERYQSALGLKLDLENCLKQWQETGKIEPFKLANRDIASRFLIPEKLYGREAEVQTLLAAFERVANPPQPSLRKGEQGRVEMMLVAGFSGIGKTAVVNEVHKPIVRQRGYFIKGKFDQFNRNIPFRAFVIAFRDLMQQLLAESDAQLAEWQTQILAALGESSQVIIDVIPELELLIGKQPTVPELSGNAAQNRFNLLFQKFIAVFATPEHPLVIFVDDLQWADSASLKLMQLLTSKSEMGYLLLLGAYRDNEVSPAHPLMLTLDEIGKSGAIIHTITLNPLSEADLNCLVADTLSCSQELAWPLSELIYQKTKGNPFFAAQFLKGLYEDGFIIFNRDLGYWFCDMTSVGQLALTDDVVEFMASRLHKLPEATQEILKLAACIGNQFDLETLAIVSEREQMEVAASLWRALQEGLILPISEIYKFFQGDLQESQTQGMTVGYRFLHDRVQQAAYSLIPEDRKATTHYHIGQLLLQQISTEAREEQIFELVSQLNYGNTLISEPSKRDELAGLNLVACRKARIATAYQGGREYARIGLSLLGENAWTRQYEMTLAFHNLAAELASLCGEFEAMEWFVETTIARARSVLDRVNVCQTRILSKTYQNEIPEALAIGQKFLQQLGVTFPDSPSESDIQQVVMEIDDLIGNREIRELVELPVMSDRQQKAIVDIVYLMTMPAYLAGASALFVLLSARIVNLSLHYGNTPISAFGYVNYSFINCNLLKQVEKGNQLGQLALDIVSKFDDKPIKSAMMVTLANSIIPRKFPLRETVPTLRENYVLALETGKLEWAGHSANAVGLNAFLAGLSLSDTKQELYLYEQGLVQLNQLGPANWCRIHRQVCLNLLGVALNPGILSEDRARETEFITQLSCQNDLAGLSMLYLYKLMISYLFEDIKSALDYAVKAQEYLLGTMGMMCQPWFYFYDALTALAGLQHQLLSSSQTWQRVAKNLGELQEHWASHAPMNFQHKCDLIEAEHHRVLGEKMEAIELYDRAIAGAKENEYIQEEALANELAAKFYLDWGKETIAEAYMQKAYYGYARWGAKAKTDQLEEKYPQLLAPILQQPRLQLQSGQTATSTLTRTSGSSISTSGFTLDWTTAMKASQSLSSEIHPDKLISALMKASVENAGADGGILLLQQPEGWQVAARYSQKGCDLHSNPTTDEGAIPTSVINKVKRSIEAIIVNDFPRDTQFIADPYLVRGQPFSFLCVPILNQGKLIGILYLENHLAIGAFTSDRVELLNMLCSQAAISLENARLYQKAQDYAEQSRDYAQKLEQSLADLQRSQLQLVQSEKMALLGNLVAGVGHEINNPLGFLSGSVDCANKHFQDLSARLQLYQQQCDKLECDISDRAEDENIAFVLEDFPDLLGTMKHGIDRLKEISQGLRIFSRTDNRIQIGVNVHEGLESTLLILKYRLKANGNRPEIQIVREYGNLPEISCFLGQLSQVFTNILANAIDMFDEIAEQKSRDGIAENSPKIIIRTAPVGDRIRIEIQDNGMGMDEEVRSRIFDSSFTTKAVGKGTGLGLAIAHQIITEKHGGKITCESVLGKGTQFEIVLPISE